MNNQSPEEQRRTSEALSLAAEASHRELIRTRQQVQYDIRGKLMERGLVVGSDSEAIVQGFGVITKWIEAFAGDTWARYVERLSYADLLESVPAIEAAWLHFQESLVKWNSLVAQPVRAGLKSPVVGDTPDPTDMIGRAVAKAIHSIEPRYREARDKARLRKNPEPFTGDTLVSMERNPRLDDRLESIGYEVVLGDMATGGLNFVGGPPSDRQYALSWLKEKKADIERFNRRRPVIRRRILDKIRELAGPIRNAGVLRIHLIEALELSPETVDAELDYLEGEGLIDQRETGTYALSRITLSNLESNHPSEAARPLTEPRDDIPTEIRQSLSKFRSENNSSKCFFLMMDFEQTPAHAKIVKTIQSTLEKRGLRALRADSKQYHPDLFSNVLTYIHGCDQGIALFERITNDRFNPNVALEVGHMMAMGKNICYLKDQTLPALQTDLLGKLYKGFDAQRIAQTIPRELTKWLDDFGYG